MKTQQQLFNLQSRWLVTAMFLGTLAFAVPCAVLADDETAKQTATASKKKDGKEAKSEGSGGAVDMVKDRYKLLMSKLDKRERKVDPFGMSMDPENQVVVAEEQEAEAPREVTTLEEAVARFRVSGVIPKRSEVIVGARSLGVGDRVLIEHKEVRFDLTIVEVTARKISLKDAETGEIASVDLGIVPDELPIGLSPKQQGRTAITGMQSMNSAFQVE